MAASWWQSALEWLVSGTVPLYAYIVVVVVLATYFAVVAYSRWPAEQPPTVDAIEAYRASIENAVQQTAPLEADSGRNSKNWAQIREYVDRHRDWFDSAASLLSEGPTGGLTAEVIAARTILEKRRADLLAGVDAKLEATVPDVRTLISEFPGQASSIAASVLTAVGLVWICGFFGTQGVLAFPLLRTIEDFALVGVSAGLLPILLFVFFAYGTFSIALNAKEAAQDPRGAARQILDALEHAENLRSARFWVPRAIGALLGVLLLSVIASLMALHFYPFSDVRHEMQEDSVRMKVLGGVGQYLVGVDEYRGTVVLPIDDIQCLRMSNGEESASNPAGGQSDPCAKQRESSSGASSQSSVRVTVAGATPEETWQQWAERVGQCKVDPSLYHVTDDGRPFLTPFFADDGATVDATYYARWPERLPLSGTLGRYDPDRAMEVAAQHVVEKMRNAKLQARATPSVLLVGFASGTNTPSYNQRLAQMRTESFGNVLFRAAKEAQVCAEEERKPGDKSPGKPNCWQLRRHAEGEMRDLSWAGQQGEASERTVAVVLCSGDRY